MKFLLDESGDARLASYLRSLGHDVTVVAQDYPRALADHEILTIAKRENRILIANDRDFGELVFRHKQAHAGVILLRLGSTDLASKIARLADVLAKYGDELNHFLVVTERGVRLRRAT